MPGLSPYGSWPSPLGSKMLAGQAVSLSQVEVAGGLVWWNERRPDERGRQVVVAARPGEEPVDILPTGYSARTRVHEYGGGAFAVHDRTLFFCEEEGQRLHRVDPGGQPVPLTAPAPEGTARRYADLDASPDGTWLACVREVHDRSGQVVNDLVAVPVSGEHEPVPLTGGHDFYAAPRLSPDGTRLSWLSWDHPNMPWDGTELWLAEVHDGLRPGEPRRVAGGPDESVSQPRWSPHGTLHFVSDRSGWWNLYADDGAGGTALAPMPAEFSGPDWVFGQSTYAFAGRRLVAACTSAGTTRLGIVEGGTLREVASPYTVISSLKPLDGRRVVTIAASPVEEPAVVAIDLDGGAPLTLRRSRSRPLPAGAISAPRPLSYPSTGGRTAHAYHYPPRLEGWEAPPGELPPLLVLGHGGPTGATSPRLDAAIQFWTSRGFAVVDVDYAGSTGYGREYRRLLDGAWGVVDVEDCQNAARFLADQGLVDPERLLIRGGSAGGFTTLCVLAFGSGPRFAAGATYYGVADLESLAAQTHKFEARYLDRLIGPLPAARDLYRARSPIHAVDRLRTPLIVFQGLDDKVVPPNQAEALVEGLRASRVPFAYATFEGEGHGFRRAETIRRAIEAELWFYGLVLGFAPADQIEPVAVENQDRL